MVGMNRTPLLLLVAGLVVACATDAPQTRSTNDNRYLAEQRALTDQASLAVLADACVVRDVIGQDYIRRDASEAMPRRAALNLHTVLAERSTTVVKPTRYTVCAATDAASDTMAWAERQSGEVRETRAPWLSSRTPEQTALAALQRAVRQTIADSEPGYRLRSIGLETGALSQLRSSLNAERAWLLQLAGVDVSTGRQVGEGLIYTILGLPLAMAYQYGQRDGDDYHPTLSGVDDDVQRYTLALVDLRSGELVWWKASNWFDAGTNFGKAFDLDWALSATYPLY